MKKLFFLSALLCASVMANATADYCDAALVSRDKHNATVTMRLVSGTTYEFSITTADNITSFNAAGSNFYANRNGTGGYHISEYLVQNGNTLSVQFTSTSKPSIYANALFIVLEGHGEDLFEIPTDASWDKCGAAKTDPGLTLNATEKTLDASSSETFQIVASQSGDGAISYESSNAGIASVSAGGLVTAVGRGSATITVRSAETEDYDMGIQTLNVTVTGPINWEAISWLATEIPAYANTYKVFPGEHSPNIFNIRQPGWEGLKGPGIYAEYPSAVFGDFSHEHYQMGSGIVWYLSVLTNKFNEVVVPVNDVDYSFTVYYKDGADSPTAIDNTNADAKAVKVIENGQLIIIKNGIRYNALGAQMK